MKNFIKNRLRLMLENFDTTLSEAIKYSTQSDLEKLKYTLVDYKQEFGNKPYFMADNEGDAILRVSVNQYGVVASVSTPKASADIAKSNLGLQSDKSGTYKVFHVMAGRGIEHPGTYKDRNHDAVTRSMGRPEYDIKNIPISDGVTLEYKVAKPGSPASDAVIKTYLNYGDVIEDFIKTNMEGYDAYTDADDSGAEIAAAKNSPELADKVAGKMDLLDKQTNRPKRQAPEVKELEREKEGLTTKLKDLMGNDKSVRVERKKIQKELKLLNKEIEKLYYDGSSKDVYLKNK